MASAIFGLRQFRIRNFGLIWHHRSNIELSSPGRKSFVYYIRLAPEVCSQIILLAFRYWISLIVDGLQLGERGNQSESGTKSKVHYKK